MGEKKRKRMKNSFTSKVESTYLDMFGSHDITTKIPYLTVDNFPKLGLLTSFRFLEWVSENPNGVISLPTGKTPEYFIKYTQYLIKNWNTSAGKKLRIQYGLQKTKKPWLGDLQFVQIDEFYPINPEQHNSFYNYVMNYYIRGFELKKENSLFINTNEIPLHNNKHYLQVFPDSKIDISLRYREAKTVIEEVQQKSILMIDNWCSEYEQKIRDKGGIGFNWIREYCN